MEKFYISSENIKESIFKSFDIFRKDCDFFDVTLVSDDGYHIQAHKVILSASSKFFKENLKKTNHQNPMLFLSGFSEKILAAIVDYIYEGEVQLNQEDIQCFLKFANKLEIFGLTVCDLIEIENNNEEQQLLESKDDSESNVPIAVEGLNEYLINSSENIASEICDDNLSLSKSSCDILSAPKTPTDNSPQNVSNDILSPKKDSNDVLSAPKSSNIILSSQKDSF